MMPAMRRVFTAFLLAVTAMTAVLPHTHHPLVLGALAEARVASAEARPVIAPAATAPHEVCVACTRDQQQITQAKVATVTAVVTRDVAPPRLTEIPRSAERPLALLRAPPAIV